MFRSGGSVLSVRVTVPTVDVAECSFPGVTRLGLGGVPSFVAIAGGGSAGRMPVAGSDVVTPARPLRLPPPSYG